jgi:predicted transcriptional regulator
MKTVSEIAELFGVTPSAVRLWLKDGLPCKQEKVIGIKPRYIINPEDVKKYHENKLIKKEI